MGKLLGNAAYMEVFWTANLLRKSEAKLLSYLTNKFWKWLTRATVAGFSTGPPPVPAQYGFRSRPESAGWWGRRIGGAWPCVDRRITRRHPVEGSGKPIRTRSHGNARQNYWETQRCDGGSALNRSDKQMQLPEYRSMYRTITEYTSDVTGSRYRIYTSIGPNKHLGITSWQSGKRAVWQTKSGWVLPLLMHTRVWTLL